MALRPNRRDFLLSGMAAAGMPVLPARAALDAALQCDLDPYSGGSIKILKGLDAIRKWPGMYIGDTDDGSGLHQMIHEVAENAVSEALSVQGAEVTVTLNVDGSCTVTDNGRGLWNCEKSSTQEPFQGLGGLHWVGVEVVNALSTWLKLRTRRNGLEYAQVFRDGTAETPMAAVGDAGSRRGTEVTFLPSASIFSSVEFDKATVEHRLKELALLNPSARIMLTENRTQSLQNGADQAVGPRGSGCEHA